MKRVLLFVVSLSLTAPSISMADPVDDALARSERMLNEVNIRIDQAVGVNRSSGQSSSSSSGSADSVKSQTHSFIKVTDICYNLEKLVSGRRIDITDVNRCLDTASAGKFQIAALNMCANMTTSLRGMTAGPEDINTCLMYIRGKKYSEEAIGFCSNLNRYTSGNVFAEDFITCVMTKQ